LNRQFREKIQGRREEIEGKREEGERQVIIMSESELIYSLEKCIIRGKINSTNPALL
jgi:hypothetical protein